MLIVCSSVFTHAGGVTNIKEVVNTSSKAVRVSAYDNKTLIENGHRNLLTTAVIPAGGRWSGDMWVPWADNRSQFRSHFLTIEIFLASPNTTGRVHVFGLYQTGEEIRGSLVRGRQSNSGEVHYLLESEYNPTAARVDGEWKSGGDRRIVFYDDANAGLTGFRFEQFRR